MKYSEIKKRLLFLHRLDFHKTRIGEWTGYVKHIHENGLYGGMALDCEDVVNPKIRYFEDYVINCVAHTERKIKKDWMERMTGGGGMDD